MLLVTVFSFYLLAEAVTVEASNAYEKFLSSEHNKTNTLWYSSDKTSTHKFVIACENETIVEYSTWSDKPRVLYGYGHINDDTQCINTLIVPDLPESLTILAIPVKKVSRSFKQPVIKPLDRVAVSSDLNSTFCNYRYNTTVYPKTTSITWERDLTVDWSITTSVKMISKTTIGIPQVASSDIEFHFSLSTRLGKSYTMRQTVTQPSQTIEVPPRSCVEMWHILYKTRTLFTYSVDFEIDDRNCNDGTVQCSNSLRYNFFKQFLHNNEVSDVHFYNNATGTGLDISGDKDQKTVIYNAPSQEIVAGYSDEIIYKDKPLPGQVPHDDNTINIF